MKKAVIVGERRADLVDVPDPKPCGEWVLVKVHVAPMCAEYKDFAAGRRNEFLGHEAAGEVVAVDKPGPVQVGDRVVAMPLMGCGRCPRCISGNYIYCENWPDYSAIHCSQEGTATMAQYILKQPLLLVPIPDGVSYEHASMACCGLGPSFGAFQRMNLCAHDTVLITGLGPVGLGAIVHARFRNARVIAVDSVPWRLKRAAEMGATTIDLNEAGDAVLDRIRDTSAGVDCALDCSGAVAAQRLCIDATRRLGRVAFIGESMDDLPIKVSPDMIRKGLTIYGSWHYNLAQYPKIMQVICESPLIDKLISHVIPMSRIQEAFEVSASHECGKVLLKPWE